jgi:DNA-binding NtrC family response regulator
MLMSTDVLVIVEDAAVQRAIIFALEALGITAAISPSLQTVKEDAQLGNCRCVIVDDCRFGGDVRSMAAGIGAASIIPVILIAACTGRESARSALATGVWQVVTMPIVDASLFDAVHAALALPHPSRRFS